MPTFHVEANGQSFEIEAPDEMAAMKAYKGLGGGGGEAPAAAALSGGIIPPIPPTAPPAPAGWGHYPALAGQTIANGVIGAVNAPGAISGFVNKYTAPLLPKVLTTPVGDLLRGNVTGSDVGGEGGQLPYVDLGDEAKPRNAVEGYGSALLGGALAAGTMGGIARAIPTAASTFAKTVAEGVPALMQSGKEIAAEFPRLLREAGVLGAVPAGVTEYANQSGLLDKLSPDARSAAEMAIGATAAIASHHFLGGDPVAGVAEKLGKSKDPEQAGGAVQTAVRDWRKGLDEKIEGLKKIEEGPTNSADPENRSFESKMFGKVPVAEAKIDNVETMSTLHALANEYGVYGDVVHLRDDLPKNMLETFKKVAEREGPIEVFKPKEEMGGKRSAGPVNEDPAQVVRPGPVPPYEPNGPLRSDSFQAIEPVKPAGEVGYRVDVPEGSPTAKPQEGQVIGFNAPLRDAMKLRSWIGEQTSRGLFRDSTEKQWSAIYKALSTDIGNTMDHYGAKAEWDNYNTEATKLYEAGKKFSKFSKDLNEDKDSAEPGAAVKSLWSKMQSDTSVLKDLREYLPGATNEIASAYIHSSPEGWNRLPQATRELLVPNPFDRLVLNAHTVKPLTAAQETARNREPIVSGGVGYGLAELLKPRGDAEGSTALMSPGAWSGLAMAMPSLYRFGERAWENPRMANIPITGGLAGTASSPLLTERAKR